MKTRQLFGGAHRTLAFLKPTVDQHGRYRSLCSDMGGCIEGIAQNIANQALRGNFEISPVP